MKRQFLTVLMAVGILAASLSTPLAAFALSDTEAGLEPEQAETYPHSNITLTVGGSRDLSDQIQYGAAETDYYVEWRLGSITWSSSDPDIVSIDSKGVATAHRVGIARITATGWDNTVRKHVQTIIVGVSRPGSDNPHTNSFNVSEGKYLDLSVLLFPAGNPGGVEWSSSNPDIAQVNSGGLISAESIGKCKISAAATGSDGSVQLYEASVRVTSKELDHKLKECSLMLEIGQELELDELLYPHYSGMAGAFKDMSCTSGDSNVVSVSGLSITAKAAGACKVRIYEKDGIDKSTLFEITVYVV